MEISRRSLLVGVAATGVGALAWAAQNRVRVAAIQLHPKLADVSANLAHSEQMIREAVSQRAEWIVLPEFYTSGLAYDPVNLPNAVRPLDGAPTQLLKRMAREGRAAVGGAFLARSGRDVFNTFVLALPTGEIFTHDKDFPTTSMESSLYAGGEDDEFVKAIEEKGVATERQVVPSRPDNIKSGVFSLPNGLSVGAVSLVPSRARRRGCTRNDWMRWRFRLARHTLDSIVLGSLTYRTAEFTVFWESRHAELHLDRQRTATDRRRARRYALAVGASR